MFSLIAELDDVAPKEALDISLTSSDPSALIVDWLNELLYRYEAEGFLPKEFDVTVDKKGTGLQARCMGELLDPERHRILTSVKAATYHDLVASHNGEWRIQVILDVERWRHGVRRGVAGHRSAGPRRQSWTGPRR